MLVEKLNINSITRLIRRGKEKIAQKDFINAVKFFTHLIKINPEIAEAYYYRGYACFWLEDHDQVLSDFQKAIALGLKQPAIKHYPEIIFDAGRLNKLLSALLLAIDMKPIFPHLYYLCGLVYLWKNQIQFASKYFQQAQNHKLPNEDNYIEQSIAGLSAADLIPFVSDKNDKEAFSICRGILFLNLDNFAEAERSFTKAITLNKNNAKAHSYLGLISSTTSPQQAFQHFNLSISLSPSAANYYRRGYGYLLQSDLSQALSDFALAFVKDPQNEQCYRNLFGFFLNENLEKLSKEFIFNIIQRLPVKQQLYFFGEALDQEGTLGQRFWKQEGSAACRFDKGMLGKICDYLVEHDPNFIDPRREDSLSLTMSFMRFFQPISNLMGSSVASPDTPSSSSKS